MSFIRSIAWEERNRRNTPPLHITSHGERFSTLTGVKWLDKSRFVVAHRSGLRMALFDMHQGDVPVTIARIPHLSDSLTAKRIGDETWEIAVSGCWDYAYSLHRLSTQGSPGFKLIDVKHATDRTFCHGVVYDAAGNLWLSFSTGENPRIEVGGVAWRLPAPWGARDVCIDEGSGLVYCVAVSKNPLPTAYTQTATSIWQYDAAASSWNMIHAMEDVHSDACRIHAGTIWLPDQAGNRVFGIDLNGRMVPTVIQDEHLDFPHGLDISKAGILAVANYGNSSLALYDLN